MTASENKLIASMIREYANLLCRMKAADALLHYCQTHKVYPLDYVRELEELKKHPDYRKVVLPLDAIASHIEQSIEQIDATELLAKLRQSEKLN